MPDGASPVYFGNLRVLPPTIAGVQVLKGIEANIIGLSGELDLPDVICWLSWISYACRISQSYRL